MTKDGEDRLDKLRKAVEKEVEKEGLPKDKISSLWEKMIDVERENQKKGWYDIVIGDRNQSLKIVSIFGAICLFITLVILYQNNWKVSEAVAIFSSMTTTCLGYIVGSKNGATHPS